MESKRLGLAIMYGLITVFMLAIVISFIFSLLLRFTSLQETSVAWIIVTLSFITLFIGGFISGGRGKEKGWLLGGATGGAYTLVIFLFQYLGNDSLFTMQQMLFHLGFIGIAALGGIIGVNISGGHTSKA
ncbi:MAG: TIGR04086 family membrane protein [Bacillota bacterium]|uniref:TIGR04086 family membrane protein n=1 Tax=Bacillus sp. RO2 TaxID=2723913 RepID=UPI00145C4011|nr:TIGR04086 family membrane protein [Bacillus sp. RO2]MEA3322129.1 TIGR04086 family membrane protein [Bacillota bacterium]NMH75079.1 TIGR04086 family membrane protein [Bacillus sp. RO2]